VDSISEILQGFEFAGAHTRSFSANTTKIEGGFSRLFQDLFGETKIKTEYNKQAENNNSNSFATFNSFSANNNLTEDLENRFRESFTERLKAEQKSASNNKSQRTKQKETDKKFESPAKSAKNATAEKPEPAGTIKESANAEEKSDKSVSENENREKTDQRDAQTNKKAETDTNKNESELNNKDKTTNNSKIENTKDSNPDNEKIADGEKNVELKAETADSEKDAEQTTENAEAEVTELEISTMPEIEAAAPQTEILPSETAENNEEANTDNDIEKQTSAKTETVPSTEQEEQTETGTNITEAELNQETGRQNTYETAEQQIVTTDINDNEQAEATLNIEIEKSADQDKENPETNQTRTENNNSQDSIKIEDLLLAEDVENGTTQIAPTENSEKTTDENAGQIKTENITDKLMKFAAMQPEKLLEEPEFRELMINLADKICALAESTGLAEQIEAETTITADEFFGLLKDYFENPQPEKLANLEKVEFSQWHKLADTLKDYSVLQWSTESVETETVNSALRKISPELNPLSVAENMSTEDIARMNAIARMALKINSDSQGAENTKENTKESGSNAPANEMIKESADKQPDNSSDKREHHHNSSDFLTAGTKINSAKTEKTAPKFTLPTETPNTPDKIETALNKGRENNLSGIENSSEYARATSKSTIRGFATESNLLVKQIMEQARKLNPPKLNTIRIILKPENLGQLRLSVSKETNSDGFRVSFAAETAATKEMIERNINQIRESLKNQGINASSIDVDLSGENEKRNFSHRGARKKKWGKTKVETMETGAVKKPEAMSENIVNRYA
jgi:flagellar hook-length control protein FliK